MNTALVIAEKGLKLVAKIIEMAGQGVSEEEIRKRLAEPGGVAQDLLDAVTARKKAGEDYIEHGA